MKITCIIKARENTLQKLYIASPHDCAARLYRRIPPFQKKTFFLAASSMLLVHFYMFVNKLLNHDELWSLLNSNEMTTSGRWALRYFTALSSAVSMPWVNGLICVFLFALTCNVLVSLFRVRRTLSAVLLCFSFAAFPSAAATLTYCFQADGSFFGIFLATVAVWLMRRYKWGGIPALLCIGTSVGIYQAYFSFSAALCVLLLALDMLDGQSDLRALLLRGLYYVAVLLAGMGFYFVGLRLRLDALHTTLTEYQGISQMGAVSAAQIVQAVGEAYRQFFRYYLENCRQFHYQISEPIAWAGGLAGLTAVAVLAVRTQTHRKPLQLLLLLVLIALIPLGCNLVYVMAPGSVVHSVMMYPLVLAPIFLIVLAERLCARVSRPFSRGIAWLLSTILLFSCTFFAYNDALLINQGYLRQQISTQQAFAYTNRLAARLENIEGYTLHTPVAPAGAPAYGTVRDPLENYAGLRHLTGMVSGDTLIRAYSFGRLPMDYLGLPNPWMQGNELSVFLAQHADAIEAMPIYPAAGSIALMDGVLVVHFGDDESN